jgi:beta-galactosidase GanA
MTNIKRVFTVDGKPFFPLGCESLYVAGYSVRKESETDEAFKAVKDANCNTSMIDIYWDQLNPKEGEYDFSSIDALIAGARKFGLKLILLWFGTWKNGNMDYAPAWVKNDRRRFKRVKSCSGKELWNLSSFCKANMDADKTAFAACAVT